MKFNVIIWGLIIFSLLACNDENPLLVNPPAKNETVKVRFINLSGDNNIRSLQLEDIKIENISFANTSKAIKPSSDSAFIKVLNNNVNEFELSNQIKYLRNTNYSFVALNKTTCNNCSVDTIITLRTTAAIPESPTQSLVKFLNAFPDTNFRYLLKFGCPSGDVLISQQSYMQYNLNPMIIESGKMSISLIKVPTNNASQESFVNLYDLDINTKSQYVLILTKVDGKEKLLLLDENNQEVNAINEMPINSDRNTGLRVVNLSSETIDIDKYGDNSPIAQSIPSNYIDAYKNVTVCNSLAYDTLAVSYGGTESTKNSISFKVNTNYTYIVFDSLSQKASESILVENTTANLTSNNALLRVVNAGKFDYQLTVALGAKYEEKSESYPFAYSSGTLLSSKQEFGSISNPVKISKGIIPINIFTSTEPARLIYSTRAEIDANKNYLIVITTDINNNIKVILIDESAENTQVKYLEEGIFVQLVNGIKSTDNMKVSFESQSGESRLLQNAEINFTNSIATVIENKQQNITINGKSFVITPEKSKRTLVIASKLDDNINVVSTNSFPFYNSNILQYRFINVSDVDLINIKRDTSATAVIEEGVPINTFSSYSSINREMKLTYYVYTSNLQNYINRISDLYFTLGKSYSIIFGGQVNNNCIKEFDRKNPKTEPNCYFVILQQDF
ncbi:MAG TPA: hypothetical protein PLE30_03815 [Candidatus Kapabacteria bacterium]|nr:hypothetical protein [Candidatus Kapabacteria bacterium]